MRRLGSILMVAFALASCSKVAFEDAPQTVQGELSVTLRQDTGVTAVKAADEVPEIGDFIVEVHETSTDRLFFRKTYTDAQGMKIPLNAGEHRLFAYYGDPQKAGFKACYYTADTLFEVLPQQLTQIEAVARLATVKVAVKFGQTLSHDYDQFYAEVVAANGAELRFVKNEKRNGYVPAGDIGVGGREIGYMFGQYKRLRDEFTGVFTGKGQTFGGSPMRPEATGYGTCYFAAAMLATKGDSYEGKTVTISGSGNVAQFAAQKVLQLGGKVLTLSDSNGFIYDPDGIDAEKLA